MNNSYPPAEISWVVENTGIFLINKATGLTIFQDYPQAAIWDFFTRQYPLEKMITLIMVIAAIAEDEAKQLILECQEKWLKMGFLVEEING